MPTLAVYGGVVGAGVSGTFLWVIGVLNAVVLAGIVRLSREVRHDGLDEAQLDARLAGRGLMSRVCGRRLGLIHSSRQMYPVGLLFGLGFDTASEVGLLTITAGVASTLPLPAILALPILFAAGMSAMDTADGVFMTAAYGWALATPARKLFYNVVVTGLSVVVALAIGTVELLQVLGHQLAFRGGFWSALDALSFTNLGYAIAGLFVVTWLAALAVWRLRGLEERWRPAAPESR
jgi:high-affinity nickel-transport protein